MRYFVALLDLFVFNVDLFGQWTNIFHEYEYDEYAGVELDRLFHVEPIQPAGS